jgi:hypothetical protein
MQYYVGYKLTNELDVLTHTAGLERRFEKVYERSIKLYKEFDNTFTVVVKNQDQKKQFVNGTSCLLQISDQDGTLIVEKDGTITDDGSTAATKGHITFTITESDMLKLDQIFYHGVLYADTRYNAAIQFEVVGDTSPEFTASQLLTSFELIGDEYVSSSVDAEPNKNSNSALHTAVYYLTNFSGTIKIFGTMTDGASYATDAQQTEFFQIDSQTYTEQSTPAYVNFTGVFKRIAFVIQSTDSSTVLVGLDKILYRS